MKMSLNLLHLLKQMMIMIMMSKLNPMAPQVMKIPIQTQIKLL